MKYEDVIKKMKSLENPKAAKVRARFGINPDNLGLTVTIVRGLAKEIGKNHNLALRLWESEIHDARIIAAHIDDSKQVTEDQMEQWAMDFNSWDICDSTCMHLFYKTQFAHEKIEEWTKRSEEFVKRAGFTLIASIAIHDKKLGSEKFDEFFSIIKREAVDERNYVKKAVNWALRQIGKRSWDMNKKAIKVAREIQKMDSKSAKWIANDAIRELTSEKVKRRIDRIKK